jgi:CRISPR-associated protein Cmx8
MPVSTKPRITKPKTPEVPSVLTIRYDLNELPTSFERAGLAGLVLHVQHMQDKLQGGIYRIRDLSDSGITLELDQSGLTEAFDDLYGSTLIEKRYGKAQISKNGGEPPTVLRTEPRLNKAGKEIGCWYVYSSTEPSGSLLSVLPAPWLKLHRTFVWDYLYHHPRQKIAFENRARGLPNKDSFDEWSALVKGNNQNLTMALMLGAQEKNGDGVDFQKTAENRLLLRFWPFVTQLSQVQKVTDTHKKKPKISDDGNGMVAAIPDVSALADFCECFHEVLKQRIAETGLELTHNKTPRGSVIQFNAESAMQFGDELRRAMYVLGRSEVAPAVAGFDVFHMQRDGHFLTKTRITPTPEQCSTYTSIQKNYWNFFFKRLLVQNLIANREWLFGLSTLFEVLPKSVVLEDNSYFRHDAELAINLEGLAHMSNSISQTEHTKWLQRIQQFCNVYIHRNLEEKHQMTWKRSEGSQGYPINTSTGARLDPDVYDKQKRSLVDRTYYAVRSSRTAKRFIEYFATTIAPHSTAEEFVSFTQYLFGNPWHARITTLLALTSIRPSERKPQLKSTTPSDEGTLCE